MTLRISIGDGIHLSGVAEADDPEFLDRAAGQIAALLASGRANQAASLATIDMIGDVERATLDAFNATDLDYDRTATVDTLFHAQAARTPDRPAASFGERTLTYAQLETAAAELGRRLAAAGIGRGDRVGHRGAPGTRHARRRHRHPRPRRRLRAARPDVPDRPSAIHGRRLRHQGAARHGRDGPRARPAGHRRRGSGGRAGSRGGVGEPDGRPRCGRPRLRDLHVGLDRHAQGRDGRAPQRRQLLRRRWTRHRSRRRRRRAGVWLAVTSLSFDISVLELLWTLTRGFHVVLKADRGIPMPARRRRAIAACHRHAPGLVQPLLLRGRRGHRGSDGYRLLLDGARFADANGFEAVWTPERHFHAFGGAYPNPSRRRRRARRGHDTTSRSAPAASCCRCTRRSASPRSGRSSTTSPMAASAISFAAGWQPNDFVLNPASLRHAPRSDLPQRIDTVRRLWRGETVELARPRRQPGRGPHVAASGAARAAGLAHVGRHRRRRSSGRHARRQRAHPPARPIDRAAHGEDRALPRPRGAKPVTGRGPRHADAAHVPRPTTPTAPARRAREPMKAYLGTAVGLLKRRGLGVPDVRRSGQGHRRAVQVADRRGDGPAARGRRPPLPRHERPVRHARRRRRRSSSSVSAAGVDEVACLIDFGVETDRRPEFARPAASRPSRWSTRPARALRRPRRAAPSRRSTRRATRSPRWSPTRRHATCSARRRSPRCSSPIRPTARRCGKVEHLMIGGEALSDSAGRRAPAAAPRPLHEHVRADRDHHLVAGARDRRRRSSASIPIGTPIANTTIYVLDRRRRPLPARRVRRAAHRRRGRRPRLPRPPRADRRALRRAPGHGPRVRHRRRRARSTRPATSSSPAAPTTR